jgi:hypothetical protein
MAALARFLELPLVGIIVAGGTPLKFQSYELHGFPVITHHRVAPGALDPLVFSRETEFRPQVVIFRGGFPCILLVAVLALHGELSAVRIRVAHVAVAGESHERMGGHQRAIGADISGGHACGCMAFRTFERPVFPLEYKPGLGMVKAVRVKTDNPECAPVVFLVALHALSTRERGVKASSLRDAGLKFCVAFQAVVIRDRFAERVALGAIAHPLQCRMGSREFPGRELCMQRGSQSEERTHDEPRAAEEGMRSYHTHL